MSDSIDLKQWREQNLFHKLVYDWILVPVGIIVILCIVIIINQIFRAIGFNFPANVAGMLIMSVILIIGERNLKESTMASILKWINPAVEFIMNWMVIFFFPPLLTIIISNNLPSGIDILKLIIVFFLGLIIFIPFVGFFIHYASIFFEKFKKSIGIKKNNTTKINEKEKEIDIKNTSTTNSNNTNNNNNNNVEVVIDEKESTNEDEDSENTKKIDISDIQSCDPNHDITTISIEKLTIETIDNETIPTINTDKTTNTTTTTNANTMNKTTTTNSNTSSKSSKPKFQWKSSALPSKYSFITYLLIYAVSWIPAALWDFPQPLHIAATVLSFFISLGVPDRLRVIFHPLICCTFVSYAVFWIQGLIFGRSLKDEVRLYTNNSKYLLYLNDTSLPFPKATELLFALLDVTVVTFSFKILEHHRLILRHIFELVGSIILLSLTSMIVHILLCRLLGVAPLYSLSMASRSSTNPLAVQVVNYLHSDMAIAIVLVAFTGVFTDIMGLPLLKLVRFPLKDSLAHGACMGCAGHAMATAGLVKDFPSASAVSSISFVLFSTCCVIWSAIPPIASLLRYVAGM